MPKRRFQMFIDTIQFARLLDIAKSSRFSVAEHIRRAVEAYLTSLGK